MPHSPSKSIDSPQTGPYEHLSKIVQKHINSHYRRPYREHNLLAFEEIKEAIFNRKQRDLILDSCCGTGLSTQRIAERNPDSLVIGIDQSLSRLQRKSEDFDERAPNSKLWQANCEDIWRLCVDSNIKFDQHFILYPNPYPKPEHFKRRWHGHPCFPYLNKLSNTLELRSNWSLYLEEFSESWEILTGTKSKPEHIVVDQALTLFEKKYTQSGQNVFQLLVLQEENKDQAD